MINQSINQSIIRSKINQINQPTKALIEDLVSYLFHSLLE